MTDQAAGTRPGTNRHAAGFSLMELMVSIGILSTAILLVVGVFTFLFRSSQKSVDLSAGTNSDKAGVQARSVVTGGNLTFQGQSVLDTQPQNSNPTSVWAGGNLNVKPIEVDNPTRDPLGTAVTMAILKQATSQVINVATDLSTIVDNIMNSTVTTGSRSSAESENTHNITTTMTFARHLSSGTGTTVSTVDQDRAAGTPETTNLSLDIRRCGRPSPRWCSPTCWSAPMASSSSTRAATSIATLHGQRVAARPCRTTERFVRQATRPRGLITPSRPSCFPTSTAPVATSSGSAGPRRAHAP